MQNCYTIRNTKTRNTKVHETQETVFLRDNPKLTKWNKSFFLFKQLYSSWGWLTSSWPCRVQTPWAGLVPTSCRALSRPTRHFSDSGPPTATRICWPTSWHGSSLPPRSQETLFPYFWVPLSLEVCVTCLRWKRVSLITSGTGIGSPLPNVTGYPCLTCNLYLL